MTSAADLYDWNDIPERIEDDPALAWMVARVVAVPPLSPGAVALWRQLEDDLVEIWRAEIRELQGRPLRKLEERRRKYEEWKASQAQVQEGQGHGDSESGSTKRAPKNDKPKRASRKGHNPREAEMGPDSRPTGGSGSQAKARGSSDGGGEP